MSDKKHAASRSKAAFRLEFEGLYRTYLPKVTAIAMRRLSDRYLAEDAVQEAFLRAYRSFKTFDPTRPVWPWLQKIIVNLCAEMPRVKHLSAETLVADFQEIAEDNLLERDSDPADQYAVRERRLSARAALGRMEDRQRNVLVLKDVQGLRSKEIALQEGISVDTVKSVLKRARKNFHAAYEQVVKERGLEVISWPIIGAVIYRLRNTLRPGNGGAHLTLIEGLVATAAVALTVIVGGALIYPVAENAFAQPAFSEVNSGALGLGNPGASSDGTEALNDEPHEVSHTVRSRDHVQEGPAATVTTYAGVEKGEERTNLHYGTEAEVGDNNPTLEGNKPFNCNAGVVGGLACTVVNTLPE